MAKPQWISASDPYFNQFTYQGEFGEENPYTSTIRGLQTPELWQSVARSLGYSGPFETQVISSDPGEGGGGLVNVPAPEFEQFIAQKKAEGYDFVTKGDQIDKDSQTVGLKTPTGEVVAQRPVKAAGFGEFFKEFVLPSFAAYGAVNFLGPRLEGLTNALSGGGQLSAAELANIPTGTMGQVSQPPALGAEGAGAMYTDVSMAPGTETGLFGEQFHPIKNYPYSDVTLNTLAEPVASVTTPAAQLTDAANAMQLSPMTQLQPITFAGEPYLTAGAGAGGGLNALTGIEALAGVPVDPAFAAGMGVDAGMAALAPAAAGATGGGAALQALGGSLQAGTTPGALGSAMGSTTAALATGAGAAMTGIPFLDKAIDFVASPAGAAIVSGVSNVVGGIAGANAAEKAAETQAAAADRALQLQREMYEKSLELGKPYYEAGVNALGKLTRGEVLPEPGYAFRLGEGMKALERVQAARGNMLSGGALKAGQRYAQDLASQEYGNAYNRLANIAGLGQTATTQAGTAGQNYASQAGELGLQQANALAQGRIGRMSSYGNALAGVAGAVGDYTRGRQQEQLFRDIFGRVGG
jgi:hypothetical protein